MPKKAIVLLADGFEEVEAITPIDYLRRAGVEVTTVSIGEGVTVMGSHRIPVLADALLRDLPPEPAFDALVLPGGGAGADHLAASPAVGALIRAFAGEGRLVAAICASPGVVLAPQGVLKNRRFTCYPGIESRVSPERNPGAFWSEDRVVTDGNLITSRGAGTAGEFALAIIEYLAGPGEAETTARAVVSRPD